MSEGSNASSGGLGLTSVLGIIFIILKLVDVIDWKWIWVLAPFWIGAGLTIAIIGIVLLVIYLINN